MGVGVEAVAGKGLGRSKGNQSFEIQNIEIQYFSSSEMTRVRQ